MNAKQNLIGSRSKQKNYFAIVFFDYTRWKSIVKRFHTNSSLLNWLRFGYVICTRRQQLCIVWKSTILHKQMKFICIIGRSVTHTFRPVCPVATHVGCANLSIECCFVCVTRVLCHNHPSLVFCSICISRYPYMDIRELSIFWNRIFPLK